MEASKTIAHWLIRVGDGINFRNSKYSFWGVKRGPGGAIKSIIMKFRPGDILWFFTSKDNGGIIIGMAEYVNFHDKQDEQLVSIFTFENAEQGWTVNGDWDIQIHYKNLYDTEHQKIKIVIQCGAIIMNYETFKDRLGIDLKAHYVNFKFYAAPK